MIILIYLLVITVLIIAGTLYAIVQVLTLKEGFFVKVLFLAVIVFAAIFAIGIPTGAIYHAVESQMPT